MPALAELPIIAAVLTVVAFVVLLAYIVAGVVALLEQLPVVGGAFKGLAGTITHAVDAAAGRAVSGVFKLVGASWHLLARYTDLLWHEIRSHAILIASIATPLGLLIGAVQGIRGLIHHFTHTTTAQGARVKQLERELHGIEHGVKTLEREFRGIDELKIGARFRSLDRELAHVTDVTIPAIEAADRTASGSIDNIVEWAKGKASLLGVGTFAYAVSVALGGLGLDWLSCRSRSSVAGLRNCGLWNALEDLLNFAAGALLFANVCEFLTFVSPFVSEIADTIIPALTDVGAGLCRGTIGPPPPLPTVTLYTPANPGVTLNLP